MVVAQGLLGSDDLVALATKIWVSGTLSARCGVAAESECTPNIYTHLMQVRVHQIEHNVDIVKSFQRGRWQDISYHTNLRGVRKRVIATVSAT